MLAIAQAEGTTLLVVDLPALDPGPGTAAVTDIVGAASKRLMHVNVAWTSAPTATEAGAQPLHGCGPATGKELPGPALEGERHHRQPPSRPEWPAVVRRHRPQELRR